MQKQAQNHQVYLDVMPSAALSYAKISPTNAESSSLLGCYAECSFILCKGTLLSFNVKMFLVNLPEQRFAYRSGIENGSSLSKGTGGGLEPPYAIHPLCPANHFKVSFAYFSYNCPQTVSEYLPNPAMHTSYLLRQCVLCTAKGQRTTYICPY